MSRDAINEYQRKYDELPFEETMAAIRKKIIKKFLDDNNPQFLLEIGCGNESVLNFYTDYKQAVVVEPAEIFYNRLVEKHKNTGPGKITLINDFFSSSLYDHYDFIKTDAVIISGLLHEIEHPEKLLSDVFKICSVQTIVHVNVPNANSLHRLLALQAGMIKKLKERSTLQKLLKQPHTFDMPDLKQMAADCGFQVLEEGSYFIKPFTHKQMEILRTHENFGPQVISGLENLIKFLPDYGAEIFVNLRKKKDSNLSSDSGSSTK